jgi:3-hydroxyacyl-CoA dehydrogenase
MSRIKGSLTQEDLNDRDLVIEAIPEDMERKRKVFVEVDRICP